MNIVFVCYRVLDNKYREKIFSILLRTTVVVVPYLFYSGSSLLCFIIRGKQAGSREENKQKWKMISLFVVHFFRRSIIILFILWNYF